MRSTKHRKPARDPRKAAAALLRRHRARARRPRGEHVFDLPAVIGRTTGEPGMPEPLWPSGDVAFLTAVLRAQRLPEPLVQRIAGEIRPTVPGAATLSARLTEALAVAFDYVPLDEVLRSGTLLLAGPPGAGKTTLAAKLAARLGRNPVRFVSTDVGRPGGIAQLKEYAAVMGIALAEAATPETLHATLGARGGTQVIVDTGGVDATDAQAWESLRPWIAASEATALLVLPANAPVEDAMLAARAFRALGGWHLVITRLDVVRRIGGVLSATMEGLALGAVSITPHFAYGLRSLTPAILARRLLAGALDHEHWPVPAATAV